MIVILLLSVPLVEAIFTQPDTIIKDPYEPKELNRYAYAHGNPYRYTDPSGHYVESAVDVAFIAYDLNELEDDPSLENYLALGADVAGLAVPFATGGGVAVRGTASGVRALGSVDNIGRSVGRGSDPLRTLSEANARIGEIMPYREARQITAGKGGAIQAHHIVEQRAMKDLGLGKDAIRNAPSVVLPKQQHQVVTNRLREAMPYGQPIRNVETASKGYEKAYKKEYPKYWKSAKDWFKKTPSSKKSSSKK